MSKKWGNRKGKNSRIEAAADLKEFRLCGASEPLTLEALAEPPADGKPALRRFSMVAYTGGPMKVGYGRPVVVDLAGMSVPSQQRPILKDHDPANIVGHTDVIEVKDKSLRVAGVVSGVGAAAQEVLALAGNGFPWQASVGLSVDRMEYVDAGSTVTVNGRRVSGPVAVARKTTLGEVSFVAMGADTATSASVAATRTEERRSMTEFETWVSAQGFDPAELSDKQRASLEAAHERGKAPPAPAKADKPDDLTRLLERKRVEDARQDAINRIAAGALEEGAIPVDEVETMARLAIQGGWEPTRFELEVLRASRAKAPAGAGRRDMMPDDGRVIEAAICKAGNLGDLDKHFDARTLEAADKRWKNGLSLGELILTFARRGGYQGLNLSSLSSALRAAFATDIRASGPITSTYSLSGILGSTANKFLAKGFDSVDTSWRTISAIRSVRDFKTITSYTLTGDLAYEQVAPSGELKYGTVSETSYTNKADTYGKLLGISRQDLINDDIGALSRAGFRLGRGAAVKLNNVFWTEFLADQATWFNTDNSKRNYIANYPLTTIANLTVGVAQFLKQIDPDGQPLGLRPRYLVVPPETSVYAESLYTSVKVQSGNTSGDPEDNPHARKYVPVVSPYLSNSSFTGYSTTHWYLLCDPMDLAYIETCFLNGQESPTVETADADFQQLGIVMRGYHDFGVNKQEYRAALRSKGAS